MKIGLALAALLLLATGTPANATVYNITLDGYCDGFQITQTTVYVVGRHINNDCLGGSTVVEGFFTKLDFVKQMVLSDPASSVAAFTWLISPNGTWQAWYTIDGVNQTLINTGTWTKSTPGARGRGLKSALSILKAKK